jgi:hypothetical protein
MAMAEIRGLGSVQACGVWRTGWEAGRLASLEPFQAARPSPKFLVPQTSKPDCPEKRRRHVGNIFVAPGFGRQSWRRRARFHRKRQRVIKLLPSFLPSLRRRTVRRGLLSFTFQSRTKPRPCSFVCGWDHHKALMPRCQIAPF